ncbi:hypothetical protein FD47_GL002857 [Lentilactobacillus parafarraginis DSM 18390 = JCM 14109]|jgi:hypothetical protein|uniref:D-alanyl-D-alanine carboxypeptidase n=2 Tax=Lentilactobacillus TaxID=2767893 RepID=A0A0R1YD06_9LACO|nr:hypothetical protein FD47_GL002857 [Lentilactobacillus parafarraginis DSM 18390 = JCM 14109]
MEEEIMKKIILTALTLGALAGGVGFLNNQSTLSVQASTTYTWGKTKTYPNPQPFYYAGKSSVYLWSKYHTTKLHNLKNYPKTTWYLSKSVQMKHNGKSAIYYAVTSGNDKVSGYIWRGYLTKGINPIVTNSTTAAESTIMDLFTGATPDSQLQTIANKNVSIDSYNDYQSMLDPSEQNRFVLLSIAGPSNSTVSKELINGDLSYKDYAKEQITNALTNFDQRDTDEYNLIKGKNLTDFNGWKIAVKALPITSAAYGGAFILLIAPAS